MNLKLMLAVLLSLVVGGICSESALAQVSPANAAGPGTTMTQIINRLGLGSNCGRCQSLAAQMDAGGPDWVQQNFRWVVDRTVSNAENLGHRMGPIRRTGVKAIVRRSIRLSR